MSSPNAPTIEEYTADRLRSYVTPAGCPFSTETTDVVAELAGRQARLGNDYQRMFDMAGGMMLYKYAATNAQGVSVVEFGGRDAESSVVYHLPMGNDLDENQIYTIGTIAAANPTVRFVAMGNPSGYDWEHGGVALSKLRKLAAGDFNPLLEPVYKWAKDMKADELSHVGYSFGADLASQAAASGEHAVKTLVAIEPVVGQRRLISLGRDFMKTADVLQPYVDAVQLPSYEAARRMSVSDAAFALGLLRATNVAIAMGLAKGLFPHRLTEARTKRYPDMSATVAWGSESELTDIERFPTGVEQWRLKEQRHALGNDIHLQAAIVREALSRAAKPNLAA